MRGCSSGAFSPPTLGASATVWPPPSPAGPRWWPSSASCGPFLSLPNSSPGCGMTRAEAFDELYWAIDLIEAACLQRVGATSDHDRLAFLCGFEMVRDKVEQCEAFNDENSSKVFYTISKLKCSRSSYIKAPVYAGFTAKNGGGQFIILNDIEHNPVASSHLWH